MEEKEIRIEKVVFGGKGLSRDLQLVTFVPYTLPGERIRVRIDKQHRDYLEGVAVDILEPSPTRVPPECRYYGVCGGCQLSHASYEAQVDLKRSMLLDALQRSRLTAPDIQVLTAQPFRYRHRARLKYDSANHKLGFNERDTNRVVDLKECLCLTPGLDRLLADLRSVLTSISLPRLKEIECYENDREETAVYFDTPVPVEVRQRLQDRTLILDSEGMALTIRFRDWQFPMRPDIFLQVNPKLWKEMIREVESHYPADQDRTLLELYCGIGFFTLPLSSRLRKIVACEENAPAIRYAKRSYAETNIEWVTAKAETMRIPAEVTAALVDPPRTGLHRGVIEAFLDHPFEKISYVSCDAASFARDAKKLAAKYRLTRLTLLDLFPQTYHFETIALLEPR